MSEHIVFLDRGTIRDDISLRRPAFVHSWTEHARTTPAQTVDRLDGATIAILNKVRVGAPELARLPDLRLIAVAATGTDVIDLEACARYGVTVCNVRGYAANSVAEHTIAMMLALRRGLRGYHDDVRAGEWKRAAQFCFHNHAIRDLRGARLGLIGGGAIGTATAALARGLGMEVVNAARKGAAGVAPGRMCFDEVIETSDVISLHCPLNAETRNLIAAPEFSRMRRRPLLVNTARGGLVHEGDTADALEAGALAGAAFDVVSTEPLPDEHPFQRLLGRADFLLTPHIGWTSLQAMQTLCEQLTDLLEGFIEGSPRNVVAP